MEAVKYYELEISSASEIASLVLGKFQFNTLMEVKLFMKKSRQSYGAYKLYKVVGTWNMETGVITYTRTQVISL